MNLVVSPLLKIRENLDRQSRSIFNSLQQVPLDFIYDTTVEFYAPYWLPKRMEPQEFSNIPLERHNFDEPWLTLTAKSAEAGLVLPGLYDLADHTLYGNMVCVSIYTGDHLVHLNISKFTEVRLRMCRALVLLIKDTNVSQGGLNTSAALFERIPDTSPTNTWRLRRLFAVDCTLEIGQDSVRRAAPCENLLVAHTGHAFDIFCGEPKSLKYVALSP
jgi:hypothetical protein